VIATLHIGNLTDSLSGAGCNPCEQVVQFISHLIFLTYCDFQNNVSSTATDFEDAFAIFYVEDSHLATTASFAIA